MDIVRFGTLYSIPTSNGVSRPSAVRGQGFHMINMGELFSYDIIDEIPMERVCLSEKEQSKYLVEKGDLLFARQSLVAAGAGKCSIVNNIIEPTTFESHLIRVRLDKTKCIPLYYYYLFKLPDNPIKAIVNQCAQAGIRGSELQRIKVPLPSLSAQRRIASTLFAFDNLIDNNNRRIRLLEQMAENLYKEWFVRFRFPGHEKAEFEHSKLGKLPSSFRVANMGDVFADYIGGGWGNDDMSEDYPVEASVIRGADFPKVWHYDVSSCPRRYHKASNYKSRQLKDGDIVMEISGGTSEQPVGRTVLVTQDMINRFKDGKVICASFCKMIRLKKEIVSPYFFYYWMHYLYDTRIIDRFQLQSTGIINFKFESFLRKGDVMIPPKKIQEAFDKQVVPVFKEMNQLAIQIENLSHQRDLLLPRLMSGKLEVKAVSQ